LLPPNQIPRKNAEAHRKNLPKMSCKNTAMMVRQLSAPAPLCTLTKLFEKRTYGKEQVKIVSIVPILKSRLKAENENIIWRNQESIIILNS
jgi:hypothetical protein